MSLKENARLAGLVQSEIRAMTSACAEVKGINLAQGVCDTGVPEPVVRAAQLGRDLGFNTYTRFDGLPELRQALGQKLESFNHMKVDPETQITVSAGATGAFQCVCMALLNPGDEVILFEPYYGYHLSTILAVEALPKIVALHGSTWKIALDDLDRTITDRTKALVVNTPGNPSGSGLCLRACSPAIWGGCGYSRTQFKVLPRSESLISSKAESILSGAGSGGVNSDNSGRGLLCIS